MVFGHKTRRLVFNIKLKFVRTGKYYARRVASAYHAICCYGLKFYFFVIFSQEFLDILLPIL